MQLKEQRDIDFRWFDNVVRRIIMCVTNGTLAVFKLASH